MELDHVKNTIINNINQYLSNMNSSYKSTSFTNDIKHIFNKFIIYSKFEFFDELYFKTIETYFKYKNK